MLDVHAPEHGIHNVRAFFLHLFTITCGLLIALGLEASVEAMHHRHQREEAEATIRKEMMENRDTLAKVQQNTLKEIEQLNQALAFLEDLREGKKDDPSAIKLGFNSEPLQDAGWRTASVTGVLSYMRYEDVRRYATAYSGQENYAAVVASALTHYEVLETYIVKGQDPREMKPQDVETALGDVRRAQADLGSMYDWGRGTLKTYDEALK
jgi:hypothetical protein